MEFTKKSDSVDAASETEDELPAKDVKKVVKESKKRKNQEEELFEECGELEALKRMEDEVLVMVSKMDNFRQYIKSRRLQIANPKEEHRVIKNNEVQVVCECLQPKKRKER